MTKGFQIESIRTTSSYKSYTPLAILLLGILLIRVLVFLMVNDRLQISPDYKNMYKVNALNIFKGEEYSKGATLDYPPLYPIFIAANFVVFGIQEKSIRIFQILLDMFTCIILFLIARKLENEKVGYLSVLIWGMYPFSIWQSMQLGTETLFTLFICFFVFFYISNVKSNNNVLTIMTGSMLAVTILVRPVMIYFPFLMFLLVLVPERNKIHALRFFLLFLLSFLITLSPWILRNYFEYDEFILGTKTPDGQGICKMLFEGSEEDFVYAHGENRYSISDQKRNLLFSEVLDTSVTKNKILLSYTLTKIKNHSTDYLILVSYKIWKLFTFTITGTYDKYLKIINIPIMIFAIFGLFRTYKVNTKQKIILVAIVIYLIGIHSILISMFRYLLPVMPLIIIFSAIGIVEFYGIIKITSTNELK